VTQLASNPFESVFPLLTDATLQTAVRLNRFDALGALLPMLGSADADAYLARLLVEFSRIDRLAYVRGNDILDRVAMARPEYLVTFQRHLESLLAPQFGLAMTLDDEWARSTSPDHHLYDLWADTVRRRLLRTVRYLDRVWAPTIMCIEITQQCNAVCGHCASNSSPYTKIRLTPEKVREIVEQAAAEGVKFLGLTGGEPFLEQATLREAIRTATANGVLFDYINSNCFWARTEAKAAQVLESIKAVADPHHVKQRRGMFSISVTTEHLRWIPIENFVNVIRAHERVFPGQTLEMVSVRGDLFGKRQEDVFLRILALLGDHVVRVDRDDEGKISRIFTKAGEIDVFFNYIVPIGRGEDMAYDEYEHYELTDAELKKGLSALHIDGKVAQTVTVGWDGKCAPDVVLKCSESVIAGNLNLQTFAEMVTAGNNDPLIRGILTSVHRIIHISRRTGIFEMMQAKLKLHNSIQGYVSEFMKDPKKRLLMTMDLLAEDIEAGVRVVDSRGEPVRELDELLADLIASGEHLVPALRHLVRTFLYHFNFSGTTIRPNRQLVRYGEGANRGLC
jgi:hypothetical protein